MRPTQIIGNKVRHLRETSGATQDEVAIAARRCGLTWGRSTVAQLEAGTKALSADELLLMSFVFLDVFDCEMTLAEIITPTELDPEGEWVQLAQASLPLADLVDMIREGRSASRISTMRVIGEHEREAEQKAARQLGVSASDVDAMALSLWGRSLTVERDHRVTELFGAMETPGDAEEFKRRRAHRGHVTRQLIEELTEELEGE